MPPLRLYQHDYKWDFFVSQGFLAPYTSPELPVHCKFWLIHIHVRVWAGNFQLYITMSYLLGAPFCPLLPLSCNTNSILYSIMAIQSFDDTTMQTSYFIIQKKKFQIGKRSNNIVHIFLIWRDTDNHVVNILQPIQILVFKKMFFVKFRRINIKRIRTNCVFLYVHLHQNVQRKKPNTCIMKNPLITKT